MAFSRITIYYCCHGYFSEWRLSLIFILVRCQTVEDNDGDNLSCHSDPPAKKPSTPSPSGPKLWFPRAKGLQCPNACMYSYILLILPLPAPTVSVISHFSLHPTTMNAVKTVSQSIMTNWLESGQEEFDFLIKLHANVRYNSTMLGVCAYKVTFYIIGVISVVIIIN